MFAAPPAVQARVFAKIPDKFSKVGQRSAFADVQFHGAETPHFIEGPSFDRQGNLFVTDIPFGRVFKITPGGDISVVVEYDGEPNGLKFHRDGRAFITDHKHGLMVLDVNTGKIEPFYDRPLLTRFRGVNDLFFGAQGDIYFTDQGQTGLHDPSGRLYRLRANGQLDCILDNIPSPNGLVLNGDENVVMLAVTRANCVWRVPLMKDGTTSKVGMAIQMTGGFGPDGMAIDAENNLAVCHVGLGVVWLFSALGEPMLRINSPTGKLVTNCAYGGKDNKQLFITESKTGTILVADMPVQGRTMFSHT